MIQKLRNFRNYFNFSENKGLAQIPLLLGLLLMAIAVPVATQLVKTNQDTRNRAAGSVAATPSPLGAYCSPSTLAICPGQCIATVNGGTCPKTTSTLTTVTPGGPTPTCYCEASSGRYAGTCGPTILGQICRDITASPISPVATVTKVPTPTFANECSGGDTKCVEGVKSVCQTSTTNGSPWSHWVVTGTCPKQCSQTTHPTTSCVIGSVTYGWSCNGTTGGWECKVTAPVNTVTKVPTMTPVIPTISCAKLGYSCSGSVSHFCQTMGMSVYDVPEVCQYGCDSATGLCKPKPTSTPVALQPCLTNGCDVSGKTQSCTGTTLTGAKYTGTSVCGKVGLNTCLSWSSCAQPSPTVQPTGSLSGTCTAGSAPKCDTDGFMKSCQYFSRATGGSTGGYVWVTGDKCSAPTSTPTCKGLGGDVTNGGQCCSGLVPAYKDSRLTCVTKPTSTPISTVTVAPKATATLIPLTTVNFGQCVYGVTCASVGKIENGSNCPATCTSNNSGHCCGSAIPTPGAPGDKCTSGNQFCKNDVVSVCNIQRTGYNTAPCAAGYTCDSTGLRCVVKGSPTFTPTPTLAAKPVCADCNTNAPKNEAYTCVFDASVPRKSICVPNGQIACKPGEKSDQGCGGNNEGVLGCPPTTRRTCSCISSGNWACACEYDTACGAVAPNGSCLNTVKGTQGVNSAGKKVWLKLDDIASAECICGSTYHLNANGNGYECGTSNGGTNNPTVVPTTGGGNNSSPTKGASTATTAPGMCTQCPNDFKCYVSDGSYKWFSSAFHGDGYTLATGTEATNCGGVVKPPFLNKAKGDANCDGMVDIDDRSLWTKEYTTDKGAETTSKTWLSDFDCDSKVTIYDRSIWTQNFIQLNSSSAN